MLAGLVQYLLTSRHLGSAGLHPASTGNPEADRREKQNAIRALGIGAAVVALLAALGMSGVVELTATMISDGVGWCLLGISVVVFSWLIFFGNWSPVERKRCAAILVLFVSSALFWAAFEQAGSLAESVRRTRHRLHASSASPSRQAGSRACSRFS